jgi:hypothetical protein
MITESINLKESANSVTYEIIREKWGLYSTILRWVVLIGPMTAFTIGSIMVYYFMAYKDL